MPHFPSSVVAGAAGLALAVPALAQLSTWAAAVDGNWNDPAKWDTGNVPNSVGESAALGLNSAYTVTFNLSASVGAISISNTKVRLDIPTGQQLVMFGDLTNQGAIRINPTKGGSNARIRFDADAALGGKGSITLFASQNDLGDAELSSFNPGVINHGKDHLIHGSGTISAKIVNAGTILADSPAETLLFNISPKTNNSLISATGGGILKFDNLTVDQGQDGRLSAADASRLTLNNTNLNGGTVATQGSGLATVGGQCTVSNLTIEGLAHILSSGYLITTTDLTNNGTIIVNPDTQPNASILRFNKPGSLLGTGEVIFRAGNDIATAKMDHTNAAITIGPNQTLRGRGMLSGGPLTNLGTLAPGESIGSFQVNGSITLGDSSVCDMEVGGADAGQFDTIAVGLTITLDGTLHISLANGFIPDDCAKFPIITAGTVKESFDSITGDAGNGRVWRALYSANKVEALVTCYADMQPDCALDLFDFLAFVNLFNAQTVSADCDGDGEFTLFDFLCFTNAFNAGC